jgi:MFS family permease
MPQFLTYFKHPSNFRQGGITASILAGAFAGSLLTGAFLADRLGRRKTILLGSAIFTIGCAISAAANNVEALVAGRVINGLGNGCLTMMVRRIALCCVIDEANGDRLPCTKARLRRESTLMVSSQY